MNPRAAVAGPVFLARTGMRAAGRDLLVTAVVVAVTAFLVALVPLWFGRTADGVLRTRLAAATEAQRGLEFELRDRLDPGEADPLAAVGERAAALSAELPATIRDSMGSPQALVDSQEFLADGAPRPILRVGLRIADVGDGIRWVAGRPPSGRTTTVELPDRPARDGTPSLAIDYEVAISAGTAAAVGLAVGDRVVLVPGTNTAGAVAIDVVGMFEVVDPADGRWFADPTLATAIEERVSAEVTIYHAVALVDPDAYPQLYGTEASRDPHPRGSIKLPFRYRWRYRLDPDRIPTDRIETLATDLARLRAAHPFGGGQGNPSLSTGLADLVSGYRQDRASAATAVALAMVGPLAAMLGALALVAAAAASRRRAAVLVLRSRGGGVAQVVAGRAVEALLIALPAALLGGTLAALAVEGRWVDGALVPAIAVGLVATALATLPALAAARRPAVSREAGPGSRGGGRRFVLDLLVIAIAVGGVVSLRGQDAAPGELNLVLGSVPVLVALAGGVVVLRLYPAAVRICARGAAGRADLVVVHGLRGVERGAAGQQVPLLALVLAVAVGVFSVLVVGTLDRGEAQAAAERVGADFRVDAQGGARLQQTLNLAGVPGVEGIALAARTDGNLVGAGHIAATVGVLALDTPGWLDVVSGRALDRGVPPELATPPLLDAGTPARPVAAIVGAGTLGRLGVVPGQVAVLTVGGRSISVRPVEARSRFPGLGSLDDVVVIDLAAARVALPDVVLDPAVAFIRAPATAATGLRAAVDRFGVTLALASREEVLEELRASPLVGAIRTGFGAAVLVALLYAVAVVAVATRQAALARRREMAVLHGLGLAPRSLVRLLGVEVAPLVVSSLAAGVGLGLLIAWLVVPGLALDRLVDPGGPVHLAADPVLLLAVAGAPLVGAVAAVVIGARGAGRTRLADATRAVDP